MQLWSDQEWYFCLHCFYHATDRNKAIIKFKERFPHRTQVAIKRKFARESLQPGSYLGMGVKKKTTKAQLIQELKDAYKTIGQPYTREQFDKVSAVSSPLIIGYFGDWDLALEQADLKKKFNSYNQITQQINSFNPEKELKEQWKKEKELILHRAEQKKVKWLKEQAQKVDIINEMLTNAIAKVEPLLVDVTTIKSFPKPQTTSNCVLWFEFSDLQLGTLITAEEMGDLNEHNWIIWQNKLSVWKKHVIEKINIYKQNYVIDRVIIACLGDMVEGQDIFKGQIWKVDSNVVDQSIYGANDTAGAFTEIFLTHHDIHFDVLEVFGNHGRLGSKGDHPYNCSMDKVFQRMLQGQLEKVRELTNYTYHQNEAWFYFIEVYGWNHLLLHGDQGMSKLWSSRPTINGLEKGLSRYNQMFQSQVHFIHCGHFHNDVTWSFNMSQILINGSFIGTSTFSATAMVASSPPIQVMHVFEPRTGLAKTERIYLLEGQMKAAIVPKKLSANGERYNGHPHNRND